MQSLNPDQAPHPLHWQGTIQDGALCVETPTRQYQLKRLGDFEQFLHESHGVGCGSRLLIATYALALTCWEKAKSVDPEDFDELLQRLAEKLPTARDDARAHQAIIAHLTACVHAHQHLLTSAELAARVFMEVKRLHQRHQHCLKQLRHHQQQHLFADQLSKSVLAQAPGEAQVAAAMAYGFSDEGMIISECAAQHFHQHAVSADIFIDNFHMNRMRIDGQTPLSCLLPWTRILRIVTPMGIISPNQWQQLADWGTQEWQSSVI